MGLLDDAIREHLDLKRARGGDPAEIERMEREALGPVRREPTIGSTHFGSADEQAPVAFEDTPPRAFQEPGFHEEHPTELEDLQELGYHDSTAPHPHPHHGQVDPRHDHLEAEHQHLDSYGGFDDTHLDHPETEELEPPKRRFLRRSRPASLSEPAAPDPDFHELPPTEYHELPDHEDVYADHEQGTAAPSASEPPPHLQFEHPPKRPRFSPEPPVGDTAVGAGSESHAAPESLAEPPSGASASAAPPAPEAPAAPAPPVEPPAVAPPPAPAPAPAAATPPPAPAPAPPVEAPADAPEAQETTEFDVQQHMAEPPPEVDDDMLEETPDFLQDTPEHDRLWFEQRPPKDFDFNG